MIKVLISSHAYVVRVNQEKIEALARNPELSVGLLTVSNWSGALREISLEKKDDKNYRIYSSKVLGQGKNDRFFYNPMYLFRVFTSVKPDVVHIEEEPWSLACLQLSLFAKVFGAKVVFFTWENLDRDLAPWYRFTRSLNFALASGALAGNTEAKELLKKKGFSKKTWVLPQFGVNPETFSAKKEKNKIFTIGFFGRLEEQKGVKTLIEAMRSLDNSVRLQIVGGGPLESWLKSIDDKRIDFVGPVTHSEVPKYICKIDALVLPSLTTKVWKEQFGHVLIEAFSCGLPVIGSTSGAIPEVVGDAGLIFPEGDAVELAKKISLLSKDTKLYNELCKKAKERVEKFYDQGVIASKTVEIYQDLLNL